MAIGAVTDAKLAAPARTFVLRNRRNEVTGGSHDQKCGTLDGAALIIVAVFAGFAMGDYVGFQQMGFGVGVALLLDATVIRSIVLPSAMRLLGRWTRYVPARLQWLRSKGGGSSWSSSRQRRLPATVTLSRRCRDDNR